MVFSGIASSNDQSYNVIVLQSGKRDRLSDLSRPVVPGRSARVVLLPAVPELQHQPVRFAFTRPVRASVKDIKVRQHNRASFFRLRAVAVYLMPPVFLRTK